MGTALPDSRCLSHATKSSALRAHSIGLPRSIWQSTVRGNALQLVENGSHACSRAHEVLEPVEKEIAEALVQSDVVGADETMARGAGYIHCLVNPMLTWYGCHAKRGREAMKSFDLLPRVNGILMSDCLGSYLKYGKERSLCNAHLLRDLTGVLEGGHQWPEQMIDLILKVKDQVEEQKQPLDQSKMNSIYRQFGKVLACGDREESAKSVPKANALICRLRDKRDEYLRFATRAGAWFDNNISENALRMTKLHVKISGCFRSTLGCQMLCRIRGYLSTMRKQSQPLFAALLSVKERAPTVPPSLLPSHG